MREIPKDRVCLPHRDRIKPENKRRDQRGESIVAPREQESKATNGVNYNVNILTPHLSGCYSWAVYFQDYSV